MKKMLMCVHMFFVAHRRRATVHSCVEGLVAMGGTSEGSALQVHVPVGL